MAIKLTWIDGGVEIHVDGDFPNQMVALNKALTSDPRSKSISHMLFDVLDADSFYADAGLVATLAEMDNVAYRGGPRMRVALVTDNERMGEIAGVYAAQYESLNPGGAVYRLFDDRVAARAWLAKHS